MSGAHPHIAREDSDRALGRAVAATRHLKIVGTETAPPREPAADRPPTAAPPPQVGSTIKRYELLRKLGEGGMGTVFLARDLSLGRMVAVKVLRKHSRPSAERFLLEAQVTARCRHDNIVVIHEVDEVDGYPYMVLEYLEGRTLREAMAHRRSTPAAAVELMRPVVRALSCAHALGIVHRDLKPENIFLTTAGRVVVLDFGIVKRVDDREVARAAEPAATGLTQDGALVGTLPYMSPEQLRAEDIDARSDLWAVGIILYELVTGGHPLAPRPTFELLDLADSDEQMPSAGDRRAGALGAIIDRCLRKRRDDRFASAHDLLAALEALARPRRRRIVTGAIATALIALLALGVHRQADRADQAAIRAAHESAVAQTQAREARNAMRMATARSLELRDPTAMLVLLREIEPPDLPPGWAELTSRALRAGLVCDERDWKMPAYGAAWSPDGARIAVALNDGSAQIWTPGDPGAPVVLRGHQAWLWSVAWSPDGARIATASGDRTVRVWRADGTGAPIVLAGHRAPVNAAAWSPDGARIVSASDDGTARIWRADGAGAPIVLAGHAGKVNAAAWSPDGRRIATASDDGTARIWRADGTGAPIVLRGHAGLVDAVAWSPDGRRVVTGASDTTARVWNADGTGAPIVLAGHEYWVKSVAWSPDGARILTASKDRTVRIWSADGRGDPLVLRGHDNWVYTAAWRPDGRSIVTASLDGTTRVFRVDLDAAPTVLHGDAQPINGAAWSHDGRRIVTTSDDRTAVANADGTESRAIPRAHSNGIVDAAWSPDDRRIAATFLDGAVRVWRSDGTGAPVVLGSHADRAGIVAWRDDGRRFVTTSEDRTARIWSLDGGSVILRGHTGAVLDAAFQPGGALVATASADHTVRVWSAAGEPRIFRGATDELAFVAWSPDGHRLLASGLGTTAAVWDLEHPDQPRRLPDRGVTARSAAWSPDGRRIATASDDRTVRIWDVDGAGAPTVLRVAAPRTVAFSPDGRAVLAGSDDGTVQIWNADGTGAPYVIGHRGQHLSYVAWSPDGRRISIAGGETTTAWIWPVRPPLTGVDDPRLWAATPACLSVERRIALLGDPEPRAQIEQAACERRVGR